MPCRMQVVPSRIGMAAPAMFIPPMIMSRLERTSFLKARPFLGAPIMVSHLLARSLPRAAMRLAQCWALACLLIGQRAPEGN
jgi:hypothetical protein